MLKFLKTWLPITGSLLILCVGGIIYSNSFQVPFHFDDDGFILGNPSIRKLSDIGAIWNALPNPIRFISFLSFAVNYHFHQENVFGYHVVNFAIHILAALGVFWLFRLIFRTPRIQTHPLTPYADGVALAAALIFLAHPVQTQAVTYITQRFASLATLFYVGAMIGYLKGRLTETSSRRLAWFALGGVSAVLGMFTKEITFTLPAAVILAEFYFFRTEPLRELIRNKTFLIFAGVLLLFLLLIPALYGFKVIQMFTMETSSGSNFGDVINSRTYFLTQSRVIARYLYLLFVPVGLNLLYHFPASESLFEIRTFLGFALIAAILVFAVRVRRKWPLISFGIVWFFLTLSVESSVIAIRHVIFEHRLYLPNVGFCLALVVAIWRIARRPRYAAAVVSVCVLVLGALTYQRNMDWQTEIALWKDNIEKAPEMARPYMNLGNAYFKEEKYDEAMKYYELSLEKNSYSSMTYNNLGNVYKETEKYELAIKAYTAALKINPQRWAALNNRGDAYRSLEENDKAIADFTAALKINPEAERPLFNRAGTYAERNEFEKALDDYNRALDLNPYYVDAFNGRGHVYKSLGEYEKALADYNRVIAIHPSMPEVYNNRGVLLKAMGELDRAIEDYTTAITLRPEYAEAYNNRGSAFFTAGRYDEAIEQYTLAVKYLPELYESYYNRGIAYIQLKEYDLALADYEKVLELKPDVMNAYFQIAEIHRLAGRPQKAFETLSWILEEDSGNGLAYLRRADLLLNRGYLPEALKDLKEARRRGHPVNESAIRQIEAAISENLRPVSDPAGSAQIQE